MRYEFWNEHHHTPEYAAAVHTCARRIYSGHGETIAAEARQFVQDVAYAKNTVYDMAKSAPEMPEHADWAEWVDNVIEVVHSMIENGGE